MAKHKDKVMTPDGKHTLEVGMGATLGVGSDSYAYTVVDFNESGKTIKVVADDAKPDKANGYDYFSNQVYTYTPGDPAHAQAARWSRKFSCYLLGHSHLHVGFRRTYSNPSF